MPNYSYAVYPCFFLPLLNMCMSKISALAIPLRSKALQVEYKAGLPIIDYSF